MQPAAGKSAHAFAKATARKPRGGVALPLYPDLMMLHCSVVIDPTRGRIKWTRMDTDGDFDGVFTNLLMKKHHQGA